MSTKESKINNTREITYFYSYIYLYIIPPLAILNHRVIITIHPSIHPHANLLPFFYRIKKKKK